MKINAIIFDMDGLMLDTEELSRLSWRATAQAHNFDWTDELNFKLIGLAQESIHHVLEQELPKSIATNSFIEYAGEDYNKRLLTQTIPEKNGLRPLIHFFQAHKVPCIVATSTEFDLAERTLNSLGLLQSFEGLVAGNHVKRGKPEPDIFLEAANRLDAPPKSCLVLEDSFNGIRAAHAAGMIPVMIPDLIAPDNEIKAKTYQIFESLVHFQAFLEQPNCPLDLAKTRH